MSENGNTVTNHILIARPAGLSGYCPREWCAVCGKTTLNSPSINCTESNCPNRSHIVCLRENIDFNCQEVPALRSALDISDAVVYINSEINDYENEEENGDIEDELLKLESKELVGIIRRLQAELAKKNKLLNHFTAVADNIAAKREAVVSILNFMDNISATKSTYECKEIKDSACSACPDKIDADWLEATQLNPNLNEWWQSGKPRKLRKISVLKNTKLEGSSVQYQEPEANSSELQVQPASSQTISSQSTPYNNRRSPPLPSGGQGNIRNRNQNYRTNPGDNRRQNNRYNHTQRNNNHSNTFTQSQRGNNLSKIFCVLCKKSGHTVDICRKNIKCNFCLRSGHKVEQCYVKQSEERQQNFMKNIIAEQAKQSAYFVHSLHNYLPQTNHNQIQPAQNQSYWPPQVNYLNNNLAGQAHQNFPTANRIVGNS